MVNTKPNESHEIFERIKTNLLIAENKIKERSIQILSIILQRCDTSVLQIVQSFKLKQILEQLREHETFSNPILKTLTESIEPPPVDPSKQPLKLPSLIKNASAFSPTKIFGLGTATVVGLKPIDIVTKWVNANLKKITSKPLPVKRITNKFGVLHIKCLVSKRTKCN